MAPPSDPRNLKAFHSIHKEMYSVSRSGLNRNVSRNRCRMVMQIGV
jgi:hypothetical protein